MIDEHCSSCLRRETAPTAQELETRVGNSGNMEGTRVGDTGNNSDRELPDMIPVRMLNEFTYCPRLGYLEWVEGEWAGIQRHHD